MNNNYKLNYMRLADSFAKQNLITNHGGPFGAVIVKDGVILGSGNNNVLSKNDPTAHAEIMAIRNACKTLDTYDLSGCELYTSCYPCPMCAAAIIWANIKTVYYGNTKEDAADIGFRDDFIWNFMKDPEKDDSVIKLIPLDRNETIETFNSFKNKEDKTIY